MSKRRVQNAIVSVACWIYLSISCKKELPNPLTVSCSDGTCCGPTGVNYIYKETFADEPVFLTGPTGGWLLKFNKPIPTGTDETWQMSAMVCDLTEDKVRAIRKTIPEDSLARFRVWGRLYYGPITFVSVSRYFAIDRIEVVK